MKTKKKTPFKKLPLLYREKFPFCSGVFQNSLHLVYICFHHSKKIPLYNTEKNSSFVDVFSEKIINYFHAKRGSPQIVGQTSSFILFIHQKCKSKYRKSYLQCRFVQGNIPQPFRATILFSYFSGTI